MRGGVGPSQVYKRLAATWRPLGGLKRGGACLNMHPDPNRRRPSPLAPRSLAYRCAPRRSRDLGISDATFADFLGDRSAAKLYCHTLADEALRPAACGPPVVEER